MASVKLYAKTGDAKAQQIQAGIEKQFGRIPEVFQAMGRNGDFLEAALKAHPRSTTRTPSAGRATCSVYMNQSKKKSR